jgi:hypothetical protein
MPTKEELENENGELRARVRELEEQQAAAGERDVTGTGTRRPAPERPDYGLSEGERQSLLESGVATSPFTGEQLNALDEDVPVEGLTPEARRRAERARTTVAERVPNEWPISGAPPAEGGDTNPATSPRV